MSYTELQIRIFGFDEQKKVYPVEAELNDGSLFSGGEFILDLKSYLENEINADEYGQKLFNNLFIGPIRKAYDIATGKADKETEGRLRVRLHIDTAADELQALSWERIYHDYRGQFVPLAATELTPFSRFYRDERAESIVITQRPLLMLFVVANPTNLPERLQLDVEKEVMNLVAVVNSLQAARPSSREVQLSILPGRTPLSASLRADLINNYHEIVPGPASLDNLLRQLQQYRYHILHFLGHGSFNHKNAELERGLSEVSLWLESKNGTAHLVPDGELVPKLTTAENFPALLFLAACETAKRDPLILNDSEENHSLPAYTGLGPRLVKAGIPAVVAMRHKISMTLARELTTNFYRNLLDHGSVDKALNQARRLAWDLDKFDWSTSILFTRIRNGLLFDFKVEGIRQAPGDPPYKGLEPFGIEDSQIFFGREELTLELAKRVIDERFLAIIGASGSGKSSLVRAGLIPALLGERDLAGLQIGSTIFMKTYYRIITPTSDPLLSLALAVSNHEIINNETEALEFAENLKKNPRVLEVRIRKLMQNKASQRLLLVVDQFEELFIQCEKKEERQIFIDNLLTAAKSDAPVNVVIVLRADFYAHCADYGDLGPTLGRHQEFIRPMNQNELRQAIEKPAQLLNWSLEPQLVDQLLDDFRDEPGALPFLSYALWATWLRRQWRTLTIDGYRKAGGVKKAIATTAEDVYNNLTPDQCEIARNIFSRLTTLSEVTVATKRRASVERFIDQIHDTKAIEDVIGKLTEPRLLIRGNKTVEIAHEALLKAWPRLQCWLEEDRENLLKLQRILDSAEEWEKLGRDDGALLRGARFENVRIWYKDNERRLTPTAKEFMEKSEEMYRIELGERLLSEAKKLTSNREAIPAIASLKTAFEVAPNLVANLEDEIEEVRRVVATKLVQEGEVYCAYAAARSAQEEVKNRNRDDKQLEERSGKLWMNVESIMRAYRITIDPTLTIMAARKHADEVFRQALALRPPPDTPVYVWVPSGKFYMGSSAEDADAHSDEFPMHIVDVDGFWIMRVPVTNAQYRQYVFSQELGSQEPNNNRWMKTEYARHPVTDVDWEQANKYVNWVGGVLPTEAEWEKACRGGFEVPVDPCEGWSKLKENLFPARIYPWGNDAATAEFLNFKQSRINTWTNVGSYPEGASPYGCLDMSGNVNEWVADWYHEDYYKDSPSHNPYGPEEGSRYAADVTKINPILQTNEGAYQRTEVGRVLRGGSYLQEYIAVRCAYRDRVTPLVQYGNVGFRVVIPGILNSNSL